jgi:hypothetical protein
MQTGWDVQYTMTFPEIAINKIIIMLNPEVHDANLDFMFSANGWYCFGSIPFANYVEYDCTGDLNTDTINSLVFSSLEIMSVSHIAFLICSCEDTTLETTDFA